MRAPFVFTAVGATGCGPDLDSLQRERKYLVELRDRMTGRGAKARRDWLHGILSSITCVGLVFLFCPSTARPAAPGDASAVRTPKCTIDIAAGRESDCTLIKANDEWILWMNSSSVPRSIYFKSDDNPFTEASCWDVAAGARARSGPAALNAALKAYVGYTSDVPCHSNPPSHTDGGTAKVMIQ
jgi:hypothetical protein